MQEKGTLPVPAGVLGSVDEGELARLKGQMLDASVDCIKVINLDGTLRHMNRPGCLALGVDPAETAFGMVWLDLLPPAVRRLGRRALARAAAGQHARFPGRSVTPDGAVEFWDNLLTPLVGSDGRVTGILCVSRNVTAQRSAQMCLRRISETDELTGLANRRTFHRRLREAINAHRAGDPPLGLLMVDLDHFKSLNDSLGHDAGDHLLRVLGHRLARLLEGRGMVARLGGDEFALLVDRVEDGEGLESLARRICSLEARPVTYHGQVVNGGISVGGALYPRDAGDASGLLKAADSALSDIKDNGRGGFQMVDARLQATAQRRAGQRQLARRLIRDRAVVVCYQPRVDMRSGRPTGLEALLRVPGPDGQPAAQCELGEAFDDYALAVGLARCLQEQVMADMARWRSQGRLLLPVALNAAPVEFLRDDYAERLLERAQACGIPPSLLEVEVTEQVLSERGRSQVVRALRRLRQAGVRIALDDFGTGHSSLTHLHDYPIDCLKVDRSFVARLPTDPTVRAIVNALGQLGPCLGLELVAEGVEREEQVALLLAGGYRIAQGHLYAPALTAAAVESLLAGLSPPLARVV